MAKNTTTIAERAIHVEGLAEIQRGLGRVSKELTKETRAGFKAIADHVVGIAQQRMPWRSGEAAKSLKPRGTNAGATIRFPGGGQESFTRAGAVGGKSSSQKGGYYPWLDFGGTTGRGRVSAGGHERARVAGGVKREVIKGGRYLYPAIGEAGDFIGDAAGDIIERVFKREQFKVEGG
jgi:hypothetical protein